MRTLPSAMRRVLAPFAPLFSERVWWHARLLLVGAILAPGRRTVSSCLRVLGLDREERFHRYHRVLSRANWSGLGASRVLLGSLIRAFAPDGPLVLGIDETLERRKGAKIRAKGVYRDPVRSSRGHFVKASGLRWVCAMVLVAVPWASRVWALPFLSALPHSERHAGERGKRHKKIADWAWQMLLLVRRWHPNREVVAVADRSYASLKLLDRCRNLGKPITFVTRLRLDAALYDPAPPRRPGQRGRPRLKGERLPPTSRRWPRTRAPLGVRRGGRLVWQGGAYRRGGDRDGGLVQHGLVRRALALGTDPRPARCLRHTGTAVHRPDQLHARQFLPQALDQQPPAVPVGQVGTVDPGDQDEPVGVHQDVALSPRQALRSVVAALPLGVTAPQEVEHGVGDSAERPLMRTTSRYLRAY
jgi:hypothetical protein